MGERGGPSLSQRVRRNSTVRANADGDHTVHSSPLRVDDWLIDWLKVLVHSGEALPSQSVGRVLIIRVDEELARCFLSTRSGVDRWRSSSTTVDFINAETPTVPSLPTRPD